ncbi:MAG: long-chain fatty acid--CoA ligase [Chloroflexi bacterium]|nr:long-chain fatty acid--CoA ligase [Chloroflexota bacterium]
MMDYPLTTQHFIDRATTLFARKEIVTKVGPNTERLTYGEWGRRVNQLANALKRLGVGRGDRVGTLAWNNTRHLEAYLAVPSMGAVLHTLNLRLPLDQLAYIINHAEDKVIIVDGTAAPINCVTLLEKIKDKLTTVKHFIITSGAQTTLSPALAYEDLLKAESDNHAWPKLDENEAGALCYTSGTTGNPKGALYSHRALVLHSFMEAMSDGLGLAERDVVMPVVPMFHANAWGLAYTATMVGAKQVFPGPHLTGPDLLGLIQSEKVTVTAGVPTIWLGILAELDKNPGKYDISSLRAMPVGGAAAPRAMIEAYEKKYHVPILHAWGMTELTPVGTISQLKSYMQDLPEDKRFEYRSKQGTAVTGIELRGVDEEGNAVPWDGKTMGELEVRGPWVVKEYYKMEGSSDRFHNGWFRTGDVVTIDDEGFISITDRTKDLVKSGGEWISSIDLENAIMGHPKVLEAAVIALPHAKWQERPLALVVAKPDFKGQITKQEIYDLIGTKFNKLWLPDDIVFIDAVPKTSVGKFDKKVLRDQFKDFKLPE